MRTPLNAIVGWLSLLRHEHAQTEHFEEGLKVIERNTRAQLQLIDDVLDVSRIVSGKLRMDIRPCELTDVINAGGKWENSPVVNDQGLITSRNPDDLDAFSAKIVEEVAEGRPRGDEDISQHLRKGVAGDWRNHFDDRLRESAIRRDESQNLSRHEDAIPGVGLADEFVGRFSVKSDRLFD